MHTLNTPLLPYYKPMGSGWLMFQISSYSAYEDGKVVTHTHRPPGTRF